MAIQELVRQAITRMQYDWMIQNHTTWMREEWTKMRTHWSLGGVTVRGTESQINELRARLQQRSNECT